MSTPTPSPGARTVLFEGPLIVFPDGSFGVLISVLAFVVSASTLFYTLSARAHVRAHVVRNYVRLSSRDVVDGDEVMIVNLGRSAAVIYDVRAATKDGARLRAAEMKRGSKATPVAFPEMPQTLAPGAVLPVWFSAALAGEKAGIDHGYVITYTGTGGWRFGVGKQRELVVKV